MLDKNFVYRKPGSNRIDAEEIPDDVASSVVIDYSKYIRTSSVWIHTNTHIKFQAFNDE